MKDRAPRALASVCGRIVAEARASVPIDNPSFLSGFGVFDTLRLVDGLPVFWDEHLARLRAGARRLGIEWSPRIAELPNQLPRLFRANLPGETEGALRITLTPERLTAGGPVGNFWVATVRPIPERSLRKRRGVRGSTLRGGVGRAMPDVKSTSYVAPHLPLPRGANEWILVDRRGRLLEGGSSNLFLERGGGLRTPPVEAGLLPGIVRDWVIRQAGRCGVAVREVPIGAEDFFVSDGAFVTASLTGIAPWLSLDGRRGAGMGPIGRRLARDYARAVGESLGRML